MEEKSIQLEGQKYNYKLRRRFRARYLRLAIEHDGSLVVTAPKIYPVFLIRQFIISKTAWILKVVEKQKNSDSLFKIKHSEPEIRKYKNITRKLVKSRLGYFNQFYNLKYNKISVRNQSTRWGSCSSSGNLNFNYRLALLPSELADYVIVHELCHRQEMNHSQRFWDLVARAIPDYKKHIKTLKKLS